MKKILTIIFVCSVTIATLSRGATNADDPGFRITKIGNGVYAAIGDDDGPAGSNAGFVIGSNGVLVVDTFEEVAPAKELLASIRKITNLPIRYVINTHYHLDHVGGNAVFAEAGATILAQRNVRVWERTENLKFFGPDPKPEKKAYVEALVLPDVVYTNAVDIYLGNRLIQVRYMLGHTGGDSVIIVPNGKDNNIDIIFGGDIIWQKHVPNLIDASTDLWIQTLDNLLAAHPNATFVSGHGDVAVVQDVRDFRNYLDTLRNKIASAQAKGLSGPDLTDSITSDLKPVYGKWGFFDHFVKRNIEQTVAEMKHEKRIPAPVKD
jgi:cyclase